MPTTTNNQQFRDSTSNSRYPLADYAKTTVIEDGLLLDMSLYIPDTYSAPVHIQAISGNAVDLDNGLRFTIADATRAVVCYAYALLDRDLVALFDINGAVVGSLLYNAAEMSRLSADVGKATVNLRVDEAPIDSTCCKYFKSAGFRAIKLADSDILCNTPRISFTGGITLNPATNEVSLYGEHASIATPMRTINGQEVDQVFLLSHVYKNYTDESAIRIETSNGRIKIGKSRDFN